MCMSIVLDYWETLSLNAGCNLYSVNFKLCVLTVKAAESAARSGDELQFFGRQLPKPRIDPTMYFRDREKNPLMDTETFLATSLPKVLIGTLIIFLNILALFAMLRSSRWISFPHQNPTHLHPHKPKARFRDSNRGFYILPQSTQGLLGSLFVAYLLLGTLTLYSQISLSVFVLGEYRFVEDQGRECLAVNSAILALSLAIALHLVSLAVDRTLACYLPYQKYSSLSKGTVPLWLLSIWLPSGMMGALPLAGWKTNFTFCVFLHQFNDDYLRFVSGFFLASLLAIPCLYLFFLCVLRPRREDKILYRWHRKLQAHHRLTFILVMGVNIACWAPFHIYILSACQTCTYAYLGSGFTLEYLYMLSLFPALVIPLMFSIRSSSVDRCASKLARCVHFDFGVRDYNPLSSKSILSKKSPLFFIDDFITAQRSRGQFPESGPPTTTRKTLPEKNIFVPHYLPTVPVNSSLPGHFLVNQISGSATYYKKLSSYPHRKKYRAPPPPTSGHPGHYNEFEESPSMVSDRRYGFPIPQQGYHQPLYLKNKITAL